MGKEMSGRMKKYAIILSREWHIKTQSIVREL
jgi:hypothetical protein